MELYDEKHFVESVNVHTMDKVYKKPTGEYDKEILCAKCDGEILSDYENIGKQFMRTFKDLFKSNALPRYEGDGMVKIRFSYDNVDKLYLFFLSILWRMYVSERVSFSNYKLDEDIVEELRKCLFSNTLTITNKVQIVVAHYFNDEKIKVRAITSSPIVHTNGNIDLVLNGFIVTFLFNDIKEFADNVLWFDNSVQILEFNADQLKPFLDYLIGLDLRKHVKID